MLKLIAFLSAVHCYQKVKLPVFGKSFLRFNSVKFNGGMQRPPMIEQCIQEAFEINRDRDGKWLRNGDGSNYCLLEIDDTRLLNYVLSLAVDPIVNIIDVGCANGEWGRSAMQRILQSDLKGKQVHIFSLTGSRECDDQTICKGAVTLHQYNKFKIEDIVKELASRGHDLQGKVNLIVSSWTLRHLVDPMGTVQRMFRLLSPNKGLLFSDRFFFNNEDLDEEQEYPEGNQGIVSSGSANFLFQYRGDSVGGSHFVVQRTGKGDLEIPLYTGNVQTTALRSCESGNVTEFNISHTPSFVETVLQAYGNVYCNAGDAESRKLYDDFRGAELFIKPPLKKHHYLVE